MKRPPKTLSKFVLSVGFVLFLFFLVEWISGTRHFTFVVNDKYEVNFVADKCTFCLMYEPYNYHVNVSDSENEKHFRFKFHTQKGPFLQFGLSKKHPEYLIIKGDSSNKGHIWLVDMKAEKMINPNRLDSTDCYATYVLGKEKHVLFFKNITPKAQSKVFGK